MNQNPLISVVVPVYKVEQYLPQCLNSILRQTYENLEILLVDDGSPDRCGEICQDYARRDSRITVLHKENGGLSSARNAGIEKASGDYLVFPDSDDWLEPDAYEAMLALAMKTGTPMVVAGRYDYDEKTGEKSLGLCPETEEVLPSVQAIRKLFTWDHCDAAAWDKLYRRDLFETIRYPLGKYYEDIPVTYLLMERAGTVAMLPKPVYYYRHRAGSITVAALSPRTFHFEEHTENIYPYIRDRYPEAEKEARFLRIRSLRHSVSTADAVSPEAAEPYRQKIRASRRELRRNSWFLLTSPLFGRRERMEDLAMAWGLYRPIHQLRHSQKQKRDHS